MYKSTYYNLLLNFNSFIYRFYEISLTKYLIDCAYKINNAWASFDYYTTEMKDTLKRTSFPPFLIDKTIKCYLNKVHTRHDQVNSKNNKRCFTNFITLENIQKKFRKKYPKFEVGLSA